MKVGYFTMPLHLPRSDFTKTVEDDLQQIATLDRLGYSEPGPAGTSLSPGKTSRLGTCL